MNPVLFTIPGLGWDVPGYGLMVTTAYMLAIVWATRRAVRSGANPDVILNCGFICLLGGIAGGRLFYVVHYWDQFVHRGTPLQIFLSAVDIRQGGLEVYGGFVAAALGVWIYLALWKHSVRWYLDIIAPSAALGMAIGRIGCFLNGCCWGGVCDAAIGVTFPYGSPAHVRHVQDFPLESALPKELIVESDEGLGGRPLSRESFFDATAKVEAALEKSKESTDRLLALRREYAAATDDARKEQLSKELRQLQLKVSAAIGRYADVREQTRKYGLSVDQLRALAAQHRSLPVHATQLYSTVALTLLALFLAALYRVRMADGQVMATFLLLEGVSRFLLEIIRADNPQSIGGILTASQGIALGLAAIGLFTLILLSSSPRRSPLAKVWIDPELDKAPSAA